MFNYKNNQRPDMKVPSMAEYDMVKEETARAGVKRARAIEKERFEQKRKEVYARLPELTARVFALRGKCYPGCGFYFELEMGLGYAIIMGNNHVCPRDFKEIIAFDIKYAGFIKMLETAEKGVK